ncbi:hypothetical protein LIER_29198 [Lithospermum erythrorhizon]|uniref:C3H1-type domain-containing protein n=1 Tax=Lithospermum erythrorhizon TaxID=34254 RepID=A0AAV3RJE2_LITER
MNRTAETDIPPGISDSAYNDSSVSELVSEIKPRYHIAGTMGVYFDRPPYVNPEAAHVTRFIGLAPVGNKDKQKFIHAISPTPAYTMSALELCQKPENTTLFPYSGTEKTVTTEGPTKRSSESDSDGQYWRYDVSKKRQKHGDGDGNKLCFKYISSGSCPRGEKCYFQHDEDAREQSLRGVCYDFLNKGRCERGPDCSFKHDLQEGESSSDRKSGPRRASSMRSRECWFCLSSPNVESHLVTSIGEHYYCALAKGPLVPHHVLIIPVEHSPTTLLLPSECESELSRCQQSLETFFKNQGKEAVFFEWVFKRSTHANIQSVPIPSSKASAVQKIFTLAADKLGFKFQTLQVDNKYERRTSLRSHFDPNCSLFYVELPSGVILYHVIEENEKFPSQFGREVLAGLLNMADKADWRNCQLSKDEEIKVVESFKKQFEEYDPNR